MAADLTVTAAQVGPVFSDPGKAEIYDGIASETITKGQVLSIIAASGQLQLADQDVGAEDQPVGIALTGGGAGQAISYISHGCVYGFDLSGLNYDALTYLSATPGAVYDSDPGNAVVVGRVFGLSDASVTKVLFVEVSWHTNWV